MHGYECQCGEERVSTVVYSRDGDGAVTMHTRRQCKFMGYGAVPPTDEPATSPRARVARTRPRRIWRGVDGGQSVVVLQVMGEMWSSWRRWGDAHAPESHSSKVRRLIGRNTEAGVAAGVLPMWAIALDEE